VEKLQKFIEMGSQVGILLDPKNLTVTVLHINQIKRRAGCPSHNNLTNIDYQIRCGAA
jgi:Uma2 family endonuclease